MADGVVTVYWVQTGILLVKLSDLMPEWRSLLSIA